MFSVVSVLCLASGCDRSVLSFDEAQIPVVLNAKLGLKLDIAHPVTVMMLFYSQIVTINLLKTKSYF